MGNKNRNKRLVPVGKTGEEKRGELLRFVVKTPKRLPNAAALAANLRGGAGRHTTKKQYRRQPKHRHSGDASHTI